MLVYLMIAIAIAIAGFLFRNKLKQYTKPDADTSDDLDDDR
ncbi:hypothetical protein [Alteribacillus sp. HJP-4]